MTWGRDDPCIWAFIPWRGKGWYLDLVFFPESPGLDGRFSIAHYGASRFTRLGRLETTAGFMDDLKRLLAEAAAMALPIPSLADITSSVPDGSVERYLREAKRRHKATQWAICTLMR